MPARSALDVLRSSPMFAGLATRDLQELASAARAERIGA